MQRQLQRFPRLESESRHRRLLWSGERQIEWFRAPPGRFEGRFDWLGQRPIQSCPESWKRTARYRSGLTREKNGPCPTKRFFTKVQGLSTDDREGLGP